MMDLLDLWVPEKEGVPSRERKILTVTHLVRKSSQRTGILTAVY